MSCPEIIIDDPADPRLADYRCLRDPEARMATERAGGFFMAEGSLVVARLLRSRLRCRSVLLTPRRLESLRDALLARPVPVYMATREVIAQVVGFDLHRGAIASADRPAPARLPQLASSARALVGLEGLSDQVNLGAIYRSAWALGVEGILLDQTCADPFYRRSVRVSMGGALVIPTARVTCWPEALPRLRAVGFWSVAMSPRPSATPLESLTVPTGRRPLILLGAEGGGLNAATLAAADVVARIRMRAAIDSLNVGHAAAIALHHLLRPGAA